ncbi:MAG: aminopeptidase P N-terminal domain-containing protein [Bacilli bacterium]|nr:aminopeptidase P N-terminal domain-containing protein [Bacilli bacterium]
MISANEFQARRNKVFDEMDEDSILILYAGVAKKLSYDETYPFEVNRNFYYLTGVDQEGAILMLVLTEGLRKEYLFIPPFDAVKEKWYGKRLIADDAKAISGIRNVLYEGAFQSRLDGLLSESGGDYGAMKTVYMDLDKENKIAEETSTKEAAKSLEIAYPGVTVKDIYPVIVRHRLVKSPAEIAEFEKAIEHTRLGIQAVMSYARAGVYEYELADIFLRVINDDSAYQGLSFNTIMASGRNAAILHYPKPLSQIGPNSLLLMDLGAKHGYYCADISRTIPVSGKFDDFQRTLYSIVLGCNKAVASFAKPGLTINQLQEFTKEYLASRCLEKGIIEKKEDIDKYYFHGVSHHIGLDTHDAGGKKDIPLEPGMVISDEPGLYIAEKNIGIRIEDDLLITENGCRVLSESIIKEIEDIESFYSNRK